MATVRDLALYLIPRAMDHKTTVSLPRLIKLMYLADWRESFLNNSQITDVKWKFGSCGPSSEEIYAQLRKDVSAFVISEVMDRFGNPKTMVGKATFDCEGSLSDAQRLSADFILAIAKNRPWESLSALVSATYPIATREPGVELNLPALAEEYRRDVLPLLKK